MQNKEVPKLTKTNRGFNWYFLIMVGILLVMIWYTSMGSNDNVYTKGALEKDLAEGMIVSAVIQPNAETPTGVVSVEKKSGEVSVLYVTDVDEIQTLMEQYNIDPRVKDIPRESWFLAYVLPILSVVAIGAIFFFLMNAQNGGGGANAKMMNFGKSRAQMIDKANNPIRFKNVAGLEEEKEENITPYSLLCVLLAVTVTIKLSAAIMLLFVIKPAVSLIKEKKGVAIGIYLVSGIIAVLPYLIRNIILSGWLIYPFAGLDLFSFDWKIPEGEVRYDSEEIKVYAKGMKDVLLKDLPMEEWLPKWFEGLKTLEKLWVCSSLMSIGLILLVTLYYVGKKRRKISAFICGYGINCRLPFLANRYTFGSIWLSLYLSLSLFCFWTMV